MKREVKLLKERSVDSLILAVEHFNRPWNRGRIEAVLILMDHAFELLLKASILQRGGKIRHKGDKNTIGFDASVRRGLTDGKVKFLTEEQALTLQTINGLRDAAQHYLIDLSEGQLYIHAQSGVTLYTDIYQEVFGENVANELPDRVLPISTHAPADITTLFNSEIEDIKKLLEPGKRKRIEARTKIRALAIFENTVSGDKSQPSKTELDKLCNRIRDGESLEKLFPGVVSLNYSTEGEGANICLRLTKKDGIPIHVVPEGDQNGYPVAIKRVDELGYYSLGIQKIAQSLGVSHVKLLAVVGHLKLQDDPDYFKLIKIGKSKHKRYSAKATKVLSDFLNNNDLDQFWEEQKKKNNNR
ncbi:DUF3644 domain-containing protein [Pseudodesulfovibrio senegalensis]|uniref:DUF3644 domain-containing protein n=1 Tax=Pseudodesulfovibrio senegalensis TaxID=1721087 RepID=A0A6N6N3A5_9BACT|nr:DUF3644 domain-containing protein [Pseudodesulfovibrio senegalensis]KAB1441536.1 hypothetical protein F8A88_11410 [Pseudodesulfovibrio senegalensis]